jgi:RNA polymerase sigma-70 factor, ECF subfamily
MDRLKRFERQLLPYMTAAYNLARWLLGREEDAEDAVQEAYLRAFRAFDQLAGDDPRAWLLTIVRNSCYSALRNQRNRDVIPFDEVLHGQEPGRCLAEAASGWAAEPERIASARSERDLVHAALKELPRAFREVIVLRELEGLSYKEIARVTGVPIGTVMSRLARARRQLRDVLTSSERSQGEV